MEILQKNDALTIRMGFKKGFEQWFLFMSDIHYDSKKCERQLLRKHLDQAKEKNAKVFMFGDVFDCMGGKYDKRTNKEDIRPEYQKANYFDVITRDFKDFLKDYKDEVIFISQGNHELSVLARHEVNLIENLCYDTNIITGKYAGFIRFYFSHGTNGGNRQSMTVYYNHGSGGNSPVTRGAIKTNRRQDAIDADIYISGHIHTTMDMPRPKIRLNEQCNAERIEPQHILLGCYKNEMLDGGYSDMKEYPPASLGGYWIKFYYDKNNRINYDLIRAK